MAKMRCHLEMEKQRQTPKKYSSRNRLNRRKTQRNSVRYYVFNAFKRDEFTAQLSHERFVFNPFTF